MLTPCLFFFTVRGEVVIPLVLYELSDGARNYVQRLNLSIHFVSSEPPIRISGREREKTARRSTKKNILQAVAAKLRQDMYWEQLPIDSDGDKSDM